MAKEKGLKKVAEDFIKKTKRQESKNLRSQEVKKQQTVYLSEEAVKLAWLNRAKTGESLSALVNRLILDYFKKHKNE